MPGIRPFGGKIAKVLLGKDEQFGGEAGLIDPDLGLGIRRKKKHGRHDEGWQDGRQDDAWLQERWRGQESFQRQFSRGKRRGVGAAKRGFGKALR